MTVAAGEGRRCNIAKGVADDRLVVGGDGKGRRW
jgi:hypothetical protein